MDTVVQQLDPVEKEAVATASGPASGRLYAKHTPMQQCSTKPRLRGVLHSYACVAILSAGLILIIEAQGWRSTIAAAIYVAAAFLQFGISGIYHTGNWAPNTQKLLKR